MVEFAIMLVGGIECVPRNQGDDRQGHPGPHSGSGINRVLVGD
jgi:hypothetical protein